MTSTQTDENNTNGPRKESTEIEKGAPFDPSIQFCQLIHDDGNPDCKCGCAPEGLPPSLFEMARLRKEARERKRNTKNK